MRLHIISLFYIFFSSIFFFWFLKNAGLCVCVHLHVCFCVEAKGQSQISSSERPPISFEIGSLTGLKLSRQHRLTGQWASGVLLFLPPHSLDQFYRLQYFLMTKMHFNILPETPAVPCTQESFFFSEKEFYALWKGNTKELSLVFYNSFVTKDKPAT